LTWFKDRPAARFHNAGSIRVGDAAMSLLNEPLHFGPPVAAARVTLVGAGPGDPELLTLKAAKALQAARLVLYDHLVSKEVLELLPKGADRIYVGKEAGCHTLTQEGIIELMIRLARAGRPVLRLKGGDPYIFGRGGEEAQALAANGIPFEVIPGISAAQGAAACAGIPLTHRDHAGTLVFVTGHACARRGARGEGAGAVSGEDSGEVSVDLDWPMLARPNQTVVIYMGVATLPLICAKLIEHGLSPGTPAALVERATLPTQRNVIGSVQTLPTLALIHDVRAPALVVIGGVVGLHQVLGATQLRHPLRELHEPSRSTLAL
jgi:uroporphyrin-III C-methyltransferase